MSFVLSVYLVINVFHLHHVDCRKVTIKKDTCPEFYDASVEDPNNRTTSWAFNREPSKRDCSICNAHDTADSWLVTKSIHAYDTKGIQYGISVTMVRSKCSKCRNQDIKVSVLYKEQSPGYSREPVKTLRNLPLLTILSNEKDERRKTHVFHFEPKAPIFSIVFRSAGSCTLIKDIDVYYFVCEKNTSSLVNLPRTFAPAAGRLRVNSSCSENAVSSDGRESYGLCSSNGVWESSSCMCKKGYTSGEFGCDECQEKTYKDIAGNGKCVPCPRNSDSSGQKIMCQCMTGSYRFRGENYTQPCYEVPSSVEDIVFSGKTESSVTLMWKPPMRLSSDQTVLYDITCYKCPLRYDKQPCKHPCGTSVNFKPSQNNLTYTYVTVEGLDEDSEYRFTIYSKNQNSLRIDKSNWQGRSVNIITGGSTKSSAIGNKAGVIIGILGAFVVSMAIALIIMFCRMWKRKRDKPDYTQPNIELPRIPVCEGGYEEPAQYQQLDSSRRVPVDENYQSLQNANYMANSTNNAPRQ